MSATLETLTIPSAFEARVDRSPDLVAIRTLHEEITYGEFNARANRLARAILEQVPGSRPPVALLLSPGISALVGPHAALKTGCPAMSLDPANPPDRIESILRDSGAGVLVVDSGTRDLGARASSGAGLRLVDATKVPGGIPDSNLGIAIDPDWPATIVYTSGSTGAPKGVYRTHRMFLRTPTLAPRESETSPGDRRLMLTTTAFAAASGAMFRTLLTGATVFPYHINDGLPRLAAWIQSEEITIYHSVPPLFRELMRAAGPTARFPSIRSVRLGGDTVHRTDFDLFCRHFARGTVFRMSLGLSEAGGVASYEADHDTKFQQAIMPVGTPSEGVEVRIVDDDGDEVARGEIGEIEVASRNLPSGYWRKPELTAERYRDDPRGNGWRIVRTRDLGRWREDGLLEHRGRVDFQVKIRGQRVDTTEVEALLRADPSVLDAVVVARRDGAASEDRLVAFLQPSAESRPSRSEMRRRLRDRLPEAAVPAGFVFLDSLPVTRAGKTDRKALPVPKPSDFGDDTESAPPRDEVEASLLEIWKRILPGEVGGIGSSFFDLGGDSLNAAELLLEVERRWNVALALPVLLESPTIEALAAAIRQTPRAPVLRSPMVALRDEGSQTPLFCFPGGNGPGFNLRTIARLLGDDQPVYAFHVSAEAGEARPATTEEWADRFLPHLLAQKPHGPYQLIGHSSGGHIAWEIARRLVERSETVTFLALLDTYAPGYPRLLSRPERWIQLWRDFLSRPFPEKLRTIRRTLRRWTGRPNASSTPGAAAGTKLPPRRGRLATGTRGYHHAPLPIRVILFRAAEREEWRGRSFAAADNNWTPIAGEHLTVHRVPGDHNTLLEAAGADEVAAWLRRYLAPTP